MATGAWDISTLDGTVARDVSNDFVLFHSGASAIFVNPSTRTANVTMTSLAGNATTSLSIPSKGRLVTTLSGAVRVQSSEAIAAIERTDRPGKLAINAAVPVTDALTTLVFPHAVVGGGYSSTLRLANVSTTSQTVNVTFGSSTTTVQLPSNSSTQVSVSGTNVGAVTVTSGSAFAQPAIVGVLDIENETGLMTMGARPAATESTFPHVANGNGLFTGLAFATGNSATTITIEVYETTGGTPKTSTFTIAANQQLSKLVSELVNGVATQVGGYIKIRADKPIWTWEIYGSGESMASGPPAVGRFANELPVSILPLLPRPSRRPWHSR